MFFIPGVLALITTKLPTLFLKKRGLLATNGKKKAVALLSNLLLSGFPEWLCWSFVHQMHLIGTRNKLLIGLNWLSYDKDNRAIIRK